MNHLSMVGMRQYVVCLWLHPSATGCAQHSLLLVILLAFTCSSDISNKTLMYIHCISPRSCSRVMLITSA